MTFLINFVDFPKGGILLCVCDLGQSQLASYALVESGWMFSFCSRLFWQGWLQGPDICWFSPFVSDLTCLSLYTWPELQNCNPTQPRQHQVDRIVQFKNWLIWYIIRKNIHNITSFLFLNKGQIPLRLGWCIDIIINLYNVHQHEEVNTILPFAVPGASSQNMLCSVAMVDKVCRLDVWGSGCCQILPSWKPGQREGEALPTPSLSALPRLETQRWSRAAGRCWSGMYCWESATQIH